MKKRICTAVFVLAVLLGAAAYRGERVDSLTYAVYPYLPDPSYYCELIERRWAEIEPGIELVRADWDCYTDGAPEGIDVVMFDAVRRDAIIDAGWIRPIRPEEVQDPGDIYPFALEGLTVDGKLYGIPVFLCGNFLIYDEGCEALAAAEHLTDLEGLSEILVVNSEDLDNRKQYAVEAAADILGDPNPAAADGAEEMLLLLDELAVRDHRHDLDAQVPPAYDSGIGQGYIGFSESMRFLENRGDTSMIKSVSFSDRENTLRLYADAAAVTVGTKGRRYEKCLELMNVIAEAEVLTELSVQEGAPVYLMLARESAYGQLTDRFPMYTRLEELAGDEGNHVILTP